MSVFHGTADEIAKTTDIVDMFYPVGITIVTNILDENGNPINPSEWLLNTDWQLEPVGTFLRGVTNPADIDLTGGEAEHTLTIAEIPEHTHNMLMSQQGASINGTEFVPVWKNGNPTSGKIANAGGGQAHNNLPPYKNKFLWTRIS